MNHQRDNNIPRKHNAHVSDSKGKHHPVSIYKLNRVDKVLNKARHDMLKLISLKIK